jgi:heptosyltransferase-2
MRAADAACVGAGGQIMTQPQRILVIKLSDIGDVLTATPALRALRQTFKDARIDVLLTPHTTAVLENSPYVNEVLTFNKAEYDSVSRAMSLGPLFRASKFLRDLGARRYDTVVLLHHLSTGWGAFKWAKLAQATGAPTRVGLDNGRGSFLTQRVKDEGFGAKHEVEYCLEVVKAIGATTDDTRLEFPIKSRDHTTMHERLHQELMNVSQQFRFVNGLPSAISPLPAAVVAIHPGGGHSLARRWPLERWVELARKLLSRNVRVVIVGTHTDDGNELDRQLHATLNFTDKTTLSQLGALLKQCDLFIGADSGVMHIAAAVRVPMIALFGATSPKAWGPWYGVSAEETGHVRCAILQSEMPGCPCAYVGFDLPSKKCDETECMKGITVAQVLGAIERVLGR